ncbi:hypothetical protein BBJ28_00017647 [Nothophytophthora sp. Chile5]|nr:hypothetical protein BBJ28_00017647 [Nothophytophthora sp. Chile5]
MRMKRIISMSNRRLTFVRIDCLLQGEKLRHDEQGFVTWDSGDFHYFADVEQDGPLTCQYVFVLDALNFCFWPTEK